MKHIKITIDVWYDEDTVDEYHLEREINRAVQDGMLTPTGAEIVDDLTIEIEEES